MTAGPPSTTASRRRAGLPSPDVRHDAGAVPQVRKGHPAVVLRDHPIAGVRADLVKLPHALIGLIAGWALRSLAAAGLPLPGGRRVVRERGVIRVVRASRRDG